MGRRIGTNEDGFGGDKVLKGCDGSRLGEMEDGDRGQMPLRDVIRDADGRRTGTAERRL